MIFLTTILARRPLLSQKPKTLNMTNEVNNQPKQKYADVSNEYVQKINTKIDYLINESRCSHSTKAAQRKIKKVCLFVAHLNFIQSNA